MASEQLLQPGVTVIQEFRTVSPTIVTPTLVPCAIAPGFQVVPAMVLNATGNEVLNSQAIASVPAILVADLPAPYTGMDGLELDVSINNGPTQAFTFSAPAGANLDAGQVVDQIEAQSPQGFGAYVVDVNGTYYVQLRTTATGDGQSLKVLSGSANAALGFADDYQAFGVTDYNQTKIRLEQLNFPDPRGIIDELVVDDTTIRAFVNTGKTLMEFLRTQSFLRNMRDTTYTSLADISSIPSTVAGLQFSFQQGQQGATELYTFPPSPTTYATVADIAVAMQALLPAGSQMNITAVGSKIQLESRAGYIKIVAVPTPANSAHTFLHFEDGDAAWTLTVADDGDGDATSPLIVVGQENFPAPAGHASDTGSVAITTELAIHNKSFQVGLDGGPEQTLTFDAGPIVGTADLDVTHLDGLTVHFTVNGSSKSALLTTPLTINDVVAQINIQAGTVVCYTSLADGVPSPSGTRLAFQVGGGFAAPGGVISLTYAGAADDTLFAGLGFTSYVTTPTASVVYQTISLAEIIALLNATMGAGFASNSTNHLKLSSSIYGAESEVRIGLGSANSDLGFVNNYVANGLPFPPKVGDQVFADGVFIGNVSFVAPGGYQTRLKLDRELALDFTAQAVYIEAMNIPATLPADRPTPDLVIDPSGAALIKMEVLRDTEGFPLTNVSGALVIAYNALRLDVTPQAKKPSLLTFSDISVLEDTLDPLDLSNPLGLMFYFMMTNAPGISVTGIGVSAVDANDPDGTPAAYVEAFSFLEAQEVYALAPASQNPLVHQAGMAHVLAMSEPDAGGERVILINPKMPTEDLPTLVASGEGDTLSTAPAGYWFDTKVASLAADLQAQQINPTGTIPADAGLYLQLATSAEHYNIAQVSGTRVLIRVAFAPGENDDDFYSQDTPPFPSQLIGVGFTVYVRGTPLVTPTDLPDYDRIAATYQKLGQTYGNRRVVMTAPEKTASILDGVEMEIPGYYINAAIAGMVGQLPPQQGFTNYPIAGFTRVLGSNDVFSRTQMNVGAAGGTYWVVQEAAGAPLTSRMQVTTDLTSIETREFSITRIVDFVAKFMRIGLRNFIGRFNITQPFLDTLSTVVQGQLGFLREAGILVGGDLNNVVQDSSAPDTVLIDVTLDVPYPCNYVRLTLVI
jgi:hypothetical protein